MIYLPKNIVSIDSETTGLNPYGDPKKLGFYPARPYEFSFTNIKGESFGIRWEVDPFTRRVLTNPKTLKIVKRIVEDEKIVKVGHNLGFDRLMCIVMGIEWQGDFEETLAIAHIFTGGSELTYALKPFCKKHMDFTDDDEKALRASTVKARYIGKKKGWCIAEGKFHGGDEVKADYWLGDRKLSSNYVAGDTQRAMLIYLGFRERIRKNPGMEKTYQREKRLYPITWQTEARGVRIFPDKLKEITKFYQDYQSKHRKIADKNGGKGLNFNSPKQMQEHFYGKKEYEVIKRTKPSKSAPNGNPSTDGESLVYFWTRYGDKLAKSIVEYSAAEQMLTGFMHPYARFMTYEKGCYVLHPNYRQVGPVTGREACGDPNLQQVAADDSGRKKAKVQLRPRELLGPREGFFWLMPDYSQIEVWVLSFRSKEESLTSLLLAGEDFHEGISKRVWGDEPDFEEEPVKYRKRAKQINFCKFYGGGISKVAQLLGCSYGEASKFVHEYDTRFPAISRYMNRLANRMIADGKLVNPFGRHYFLPSRASYKSTNYDTQGTSADIFKEACIEIHKSFYRKYPESCQLLFLHDEWAVEVPLKFHTNTCIRALVKCLQSNFHEIIGCPIPLPVGMKITKTRWSDAKELPWVKEEWRKKYICHPKMS